MLLFKENFKPMNFHFRIKKLKTVLLMITLFCLAP